MRAVLLRPMRPVRPVRPVPSRSLRPIARTTYNDDNNRRKNNINKLNSLFYEDNGMLSGEELSILIYLRFNRVYKPEIKTRGRKKYLVLIREDEEPEMLHFNKIAEIINSESSPEKVKQMISQTENSILGSEDIEIPI
jgi:hypothetical protein